MAVVKPRQHGVQGVYHAGEWMPIEDCAKYFNIKDGSGGSNCSKVCPCPRSRSRISAAHPDGSYDVIIIGAGCIGASIARELSRSKVSVLLLEAADDVTQVYLRYFYDIFVDAYVYACRSVALLWS